VKKIVIFLCFFSFLSPSHTSMHGVIPLQSDYIPELYFKTKEKPAPTTPENRAKTIRDYMLGALSRRASFYTKLITIINLIGAGARLSKGTPDYAKKMIEGYSRIITLDALALRRSLAFTLGSIPLAALLPLVLQRWYLYLQKNYSFFRGHKGRIIFKAIAHSVEIALPLSLLMLHYKIPEREFLSILKPI
jgi:hypothetical protein